jgi:hypothetical protein
MIWLDELKPGDKVAVDTTRSRRKQIASVAKVTKTQVVTTDRRRWRKSSGDRVGSGRDYSIERIVQLTPEIQTQIDYDRLVTWFQSFSKYLRSGELVISHEILEDMQRIYKDNQ